MISYYFTTAGQAICQTKSPGPEHHLVHDGHYRFEAAREGNYNITI